MDQSFIVALLVGGLIISMLYVFLIWSKLNDKMRRHLEKKHGVKFVAGKSYIDPLDGRMIYTSDLKGKGGKLKKSLILTQYYFFTFVAAFWPLLLYMFVIFYFREDLKPLLNARF